MDKRIAGLVIIAVALVALGVWEFWGRENLSYVDVPVLKEDVQANVTIREEYIKLRKMESPSQEALTTEDLQWLIGMETSQFVAGGSELYPQYFRQSQFAVGGSTGRELFSVPEEWLVSIPQSLRRGDKITLYKGDIKVLEGIVAHSFDASGQEVISTEKERTNSSSVVKNFEIIALTEDLKRLSQWTDEGGKFIVLCNQGG